MGTLLTLASLLQLAGTLRIAAFNIRTFGETKMSNATLSSYIVKVSLGWPKPESRHAVRTTVNLRPYHPWVDVRVILPDHCQHCPWLAGRAAVRAAAAALPTQPVLLSGGPTPRS